MTNTNSAFAIAHCRACTTVAVSFQIVLVIKQSRIVAPINAAGALNYDCTACLTTAIADQIVVTLNVAAVQGARRRPQTAQRAARARIQRDARGRRLRGRRGSTGDRDAAARQRLHDDLLEHDESGLVDRLDVDLVVIVRRHHDYVVLLELAADLVDPLWIDDDDPADGIVRSRAIRGV